MREQDIYKHPWLISFKLTPSEIDVLTCLLENQATKKISIILSKTIKNVDIQIFNIMKKLDIHARANIVEYVKKSSCSEEIRKHYFVLVKKFEFQESLKKIKQQLKYQDVICKLACQDQTLKKKIESDLKFLNISCFERKKDAIVILIQSHENYYQTFFAVLYQLLPDPVVKEALLHFETNTLDHVFGNIVTQQSLPRKQTWLQRNSFLFNLIIFLIVLTGVGGSFFKFYSQARGAPIRSNFSLPTAEHYLNRPKLINEISEKLKRTRDIQTAIILGMGGMGKTTLAREYARTQNLSVVRQINAENQKTLHHSFENLVYAMSKTAEERTELDHIKKIENTEDYKNKLLELLKQKLFMQKNWFLIFDNVDNFSDIQFFFPNDPKTWGQGKVLITTRNEQLKNHSNINAQCVIEITPLSLQEQVVLFENITNGSKNKQIISDKKNKLEDFLKQLPPFPLDVVIAAHYIKRTGTSYKDYLQNLSCLHSDFEKSQNTLIQQMTDYDKTRYGIISNTVKHIIGKNTDFEDLLLLISTVDSQSIPKEILELFKNKTVVNEFISIASQYSLLKYTISFDKKKQLSLHRSTQKNMEQYLQQILSSERKKQCFDKITQALERYCISIIYESNISDIQQLTDHLQAFLKHQKIMGYEENQKSIELLLGSIYCYFGDPVKAEELIKKSFNYFFKHVKKTKNSRFLRAAVYAGIVEKN